MTDGHRLEELRRRVERDPASIAFAALAEEYRRAGRLHEAAEVCRAGLRRHPVYHSARITLGRTLLELGEHQEARREFEHVLQVAPDNLAALQGLEESRQGIPNQPAHEVSPPAPPLTAPAPPGDGVGTVSQPAAEPPSTDAAVLDELERLLERIRLARAALDAPGPS